MSSESSEQAFERGSAAGKIEARLADHDKHFAKINGSLDKVAQELHDLKLAVQRLGDQAISRDATVITTAAALKDAEDARRHSADQRWSPWQKIIAVVGAIGVIVAIYFAVRGV